MSLDQFFDEPESLYNEKVDQETRNRIKLCVAAYAYELLGHSIMDDAEFDSLAKQIDVTIDTRRPDMDIWFRQNFQSHTGMWIHNHPEKNRLRYLALQKILRDDWKPKNVYT